MGEFLHLLRAVPFPPPLNVCGLGFSIKTPPPPPSLIAQVSPFAGALEINVKTAIWSDHLDRSRDRVNIIVHHGKHFQIFNFSLALFCGSLLSFATPLLLTNHMTISFLFKYCDVLPQLLQLAQRFLITNEMIYEEFCLLGYNPL
jgi:hypothetical protein